MKSSRPLSTTGEKLTDSSGLSTEKLLDMYRRMSLIRKFEYTIKDLFARGVIAGAIHLYAGEEASAVGAISTLDERDYVTSTHRGHGHLIARGVEINKMMAELYGRETGLCKGKGGSMHMADLNRHVFAQPIVGGGFPLAVGAALAAKMSKSNAVTLCFFGEGASNQGTAHESMNLAAIWKLPVVFICENNKFAQSVRASYFLAGGSVAARAASYGLPGKRLDGMDVLAVYSAVKQAVEQARTGGGPSVLELDLYRYEGHEEGDPWTTYRSKEEVEEGKRKDAIQSFAARLIESGRADKETLEKIDADNEQRIKDAIAYAEAGKPTIPEEAFTDVFAD
jgi:TPP-dependent pyruvate/acetoin dehydrogenase alpha subunit